MDNTKSEESDTDPDDKPSNIETDQGIALKQKTSYPLLGSKTNITLDLEIESGITLPMYFLSPVS